MTGNTPTVLIGLGLICLVLPVGLLVLSRAYTTIERAHPDRPQPAIGARSAQEAAAIPSPRPAHEREAATNEPRGRAGAASG